MQAQPKLDLAVAFHRHIESLIAQGEVEEAVKHLLDFAKQLLAERSILRDEVLQLASRWGSLQKNIGKYGDTDTLRAEWVRIVDELIETNHQVLEKASVQAAAPQATPPPPPLHLVSREPTPPETLERRSPLPTIGTSPRRAAPVAIPDAESEFEAARDQFIHRLREGRTTDPEFDVVFLCEGLRRAHRSGARVFELSDISLELIAGEVVGLIGANASGKTTLLEIIAGRLKPDAGRLRYPALERAGRGRAGVLRQIAYVPQNIAPWYGQVVDNLHLWAAWHGLRGRDNVSEVEWWLHRLGLTEYRDAQWSHLSGGFRMRFALARALLSSPRVLVLDEPLAHLDIIMQQVFLRDLKALAMSADRPLSVIVSSQHLYEIESIADRILFLESGKTIFAGDLDTLADGRTFNVIELGSPLSRLELHERLRDLPNVRVEQLGLQYLITLPLTVEPRRVLQVLADTGTPVHYYRDISRSTVNLFRERAHGGRAARESHSRRPGP